MSIKSSTVYRLCIIGLWAICGLCSDLKAQNTDKEYRNVSISLRAGVTLENGGNGFNLLDSRFNGPTQTTGIYGIGVQYALTPAWSVEGGYSYTQIKGTSGSFQTNMNIISLKNIINLNQILFTNRIFTSINPYLTGGIGYDIYSFESPSSSANNASLSYNVGAGIAYKLSPTIDLFTHYEYQLASNKIDNQIGSGGGLRADVLTNFTGGLRINFGKKGTTHPSWRPVPVEVDRSDYEYLLSEERRAKKLGAQIASLEKQMKQKDQQHRREIEAYTNTVDSLRNQVVNLKEKLQAAKDSLASVSSKVVAPDCDCKTVSIPGGHYVQVFASLRLQSSEKVLRNALPQLQKALNDPGEKVFIAKRKQYYEVLIGTLSYQRAEEVLAVMQKIHGDAFIITFPRPVSLQELYDDIERLN